MINLTQKDHRKRFELHLQLLIIVQEDENKVKSHSPTPIMGGDDEDHDDDLDVDDMGNMSECDGEKTLSEMKIRLDDDDEGYEEEDPGMNILDYKLL